MTIASRNWVPAEREALVQDIAQSTSSAPSSELLERIQILAKRNKEIHER